MIDWKPIATAALLSDRVRVKEDCGCETVAKVVLNARARRLEWENDAGKRVYPTHWAPLTPPEGKP